MNKNLKNESVFILEDKALISQHNRSL